MTTLSNLLTPSNLVTETGTQTLTNKVISADNNSLSGIAATSFVVSNASGFIDGSAAQKVIPVGDVVGTSDTQVLTNKTIAFGSNSLTDVASINTSQTLTNKTIAFSSNSLTDVASITTAQTLTNKTISFANNTLVDVASLSTAQTFTGTKSFIGTAGSLSMVLVNAAETVTISATAATGTINYDTSSQSVIYYTSNASANWTVNFRALLGTTLNAVMSTGQSVTVCFLVTQGATAYFNSAVTVDSVSVTPKWQGGTAPTAGNASSIDSYTYTIIKTASATFTVLASLTQFK